MGTRVKTRCAWHSGYRSGLGVGVVFPVVFLHQLAETAELFPGLVAVPEEAMAHGEEGNIGKAVLVWSS